MVAAILKTAGVLGFSPTSKLLLPPSGIPAAMLLCIARILLFVTAKTTLVFPNAP